MTRRLCWCLAAVLMAGAADAATGGPAAQLKSAFHAARKMSNPYHFKRGAVRHKIPHAPSRAHFRRGPHHPRIHRYR